MNRSQTAKKIVCKRFTLSYNCNRSNNYTNQCIFSDKTSQFYVCYVYLTWTQRKQILEKNREMKGRHVENSHVIGFVLQIIQLIAHAYCVMWSGQNSGFRSIWSGPNVIIFDLSLRTFEIVFSVLTSPPNLFARPFWEKTSRILLYFFQITDNYRFWWNDTLHTISLGYLSSRQIPCERKQNDNKSDVTLLTSVNAQKLKMAIENIHFIVTFGHMHILVKEMYTYLHMTSWKNKASRTYKMNVTINHCINRGTKTSIVCYIFGEIL